MDAHTACNRKHVRVRRRLAVGIVPLTERRWVRKVGLPVILSWIVACIFTSAWLVR